MCSVFEWLSQKGSHTRMDHPSVVSHEGVVWCDVSGRGGRVDLCL
jgi:hypothetical protein